MIHNEGSTTVSIDSSHWSLEDGQGRTYTAMKYVGARSVDAGRTIRPTLYFQVSDEAASDTYGFSLDYQSDSEMPARGISIPLGAWNVVSADEVISLDVENVEVESRSCLGALSEDSCHTVHVTVANSHPYLELEREEIRWRATSDTGEILTPSPTTFDQHVRPGGTAAWSVRFNVAHGERLTSLRLGVGWFYQAEEQTIPPYSIPSDGNGQSDSEPDDDGAAQPQSSDEEIPLKFAWDYGGAEWTWSFSLRQSTYDAYAGTNRSAYRYDYEAFVLDTTDDDLIHDLATSLDEAAREEGYSRAETADFVLRFVQTLPYTVDSVTTPFDEHPRYPVETLIDGGDCEDTSILYASLMRELGYRVVMVGPPNHMAVAVSLDESASDGWHYEIDGQSYYFAETTGSAWQVGEMPEEYQGEDATIYELKDTALLSQPTWETDWNGYQYEIRVNVTNVGSLAANDLTLYAAWDAGEDSVWDQDTCKFDELEADWWAACFIYLDAPPSGEETRLIVGGWADNAPAKYSYSAWFTV